MEDRDPPMAMVTTRARSIHGNCSHTTEECRTIQNEAKCAKTNASGGKQQVSSDKIKSNSNNKTWSRKAEEAKKDAQSDRAAFVQKEVAKNYMKMVKAHKKRKSDSDSDDGSLAAFDLSDFNYEDMENLSIEDNTEVSVWKEGQDERDEDTVTMSSFNDSSELLDDNTNYCTPIVETVDNDMFAFQERPEKKPPRDYKALDDCINHAYESECHSIKKLIRSRRIPNDRSPNT